MDPRIQTLMGVLQVPGVSTEEQAISAHVIDELKAAGVPADAIRTDAAHTQSEYGGAVGNIIVHLPAGGGHAGPPRMFCAHMDTVALCREAKPRFVADSDGGPGQIVNDNPAAALGADNRTGVAVLLNMVKTLLADDRPRPPLWVVFPVQEELGLVGVRGLDLGSLQPDPPAYGFNWDSGRPNKVIHAVIGTSRVLMEIHGKAAHAGGAPEKGVSCAVAMAKALADLARDGWHGKVDKPDGQGTANIGIVRGGEMTNTVIDHMVVHGDVRSHDRAFRQRLVDLYVRTFEQACADTANVDGEQARLEWKLGPCYEAFALDTDAPVVQAAQKAIRGLGMEPEMEVNNGGMDANHLNAKGLPTVTLGTGQFGAHTVNEGIHLDQFLTCCDLAVALATQA